MINNESHESCIKYSSEICDWNILHVQRRSKHPQVTATVSASSIIKSSVCRMNLQ
jgi:hypothetical protein